MLATRSEWREVINPNPSHAKKQGRIRRAGKIRLAAFRPSKHPYLPKTKCATSHKKKHFGAPTKLQRAAREFHKSRSGERPRVYPTLQEGDNGYFEIVQGENGTQAVNVEKIQKG
jgi:'Cold-shock' DNA-binding domain